MLTRQICKPKARALSRHNTIPFRKPRNKSSQHFVSTTLSSNKTETLLTAAPPHRRERLLPKLSVSKRPHNEHGQLCLAPIQQHTPVTKDKFLQTTGIALGFTFENWWGAFPWSCACLLPCNCWWEKGPIMATITCSTRLPPWSSNRTFCVNVLWHHISGFPDCSL